MKLVLLVALSFWGVVSASPQKPPPGKEVPAASSGWPLDWKEGQQIPASMALEDIPPGIQISSVDDDGLTARGEAVDGDVKSIFGLGKRSNCNGSAQCAAYVTADVCWAAYQGYNENTYYCRYTSRIKTDGFKACTAIYQCNSHKSCMAGWWLRQQFDNIYNKVGCTKCGTYDIPDGSGGTGCRVTNNYCYACQEVG